MKYFKMFGKNKIYIDGFDNKCKLCGNEFKTTKRGDEIEIIGCKTKNCSRRKFENILKQIFDNDKAEKMLKELYLSYIGRYSEKWFIDKYGKEEGIEKRKNWTNTCRTGKETLIERYGEEGGLKRFEQFKNKSKHTKEKYINQYGDEDGLKKWNEYILIKRKTSKRSILYWINKTNGDYDEALKMLEEHQNTSSLDKMVKYYGKKEGLKKYNKINHEKTKNWSNGYRFSKISLKLFQEIENQIKYKPYYGKGNEYRLSNKYNVDFYIKELNLCIEFNGDFWHANPKLFNENDIHPVTKLIAYDIWKKDAQRIEEIKKHCNILIIWENEARKYFDQTVLKCVNYIMEAENANNGN